MNEDNNQEVINLTQNPEPVSLGTSFQPASQFVPEPQPPVPQPIEQPKKRSKKPIIIVVVILALIAAAAGYYFLVMNKVEEAPQDPQPNVSADETKTKEVVFYQTNTQLKYIEGENLSPVDVATIPDGAHVVSKSDDNKEVIYATFESKEETKSTFQNMRIYRQIGDQTTALLETTTFTDESIAGLKVSKDGKVASYFGFDTEKDAIDWKNPKIYTAPLDSSNVETELIAGQADDYNYIKPLLWSEDNLSLYVQELSCMGQCDGYTNTSNIWKLTLSDSKIEQIYEQPEDVKHGDISLSPDKTKIAASSYGPIAKDATFEDLAEDTFEVYLVDLTDGSAAKIYSEIKADDKTAESFQGLAGWSSDGSTIIVSVNKATKDSTGYTSTFDRFDMVNTVDGKVVNIPVKVASLADFGSFTATSYNNNLLFSGKKLASTTEAEEFNLYLLPIGQGEAEVKIIEPGVPKISILGASSVTVQNN